MNQLAGEERETSITSSSEAVVAESTKQLKDPLMKLSSCSGEETCTLVFI